ncbi:MAG: hypothetical protein ACSHX4_11625 [Opitutaceae bacterium]
MYSRIYWPEHLVSETLIAADNTPGDNHVTDAGALLDRNDDVWQLQLTQEEKDALVAFLRTLTDESLLTDLKWSDPVVGFSN